MNMKDFLEYIALHPVLSVILLAIFCSTLASLGESFAKAVRR